MKAASRAEQISSFTIIKGSLIEDTYAVFRDWDFTLSQRQNLERLKQSNVIGAKSAGWLRDVAKVLSRRFEPDRRDRPLVQLAQTRCEPEVWKPILALPQVFDRFREMAARVSKKDLESLMTTENLRGLTPVWSELALVRDQAGTPVFNVESGPLAEVQARIEDRASYGELATGRSLADHFGKEPYGWAFDSVRLLAVALLRAGKVEATSKGQVIESALSLDARNALSNNNLFRQASFRPKVGLDFERVVEAYEQFRDVFGRDVAELEQAAVAGEIRQHVGRYDEQLHDVHALLLRHGLPGSEVLSSALDRMRSIRTGGEDQAILGFSAAHREIKEAIQRGNQLAGAISETQLHDLARAHRAITEFWPFLAAEDDLAGEVREQAEALRDLMARETFFRELAAIDQRTRALEEEYRRRYDAALAERYGAYAEAVEALKATPGWKQLNEEQQRIVARPLVTCLRVDADDDTTPIPLLRADLAACRGRLAAAVEQMLRMVDGQRVVWVDAGSYFAGGVETEEQLDSALDGLREECVELIGAGKKVLVQ